MGKAVIRGCRFSRHNTFPKGEGKEEAASPPKKKANPRLATLGSPFQGKGLAWSLPPSFGRRCPEGAEVGWGKRCERERGKSSQVRHYTRAPYPPLTRSPFPNGEGGPRFSTQRLSQGGSKEEAASPPKKEANPASLRSAAPSKGRGSRGHSLLPLEGGAPKGRRLDGGSGMKEKGDFFKCAIIRKPTATHL